MGLIWKICLLFYHCLLVILIAYTHFYDRDLHPDGCARPSAGMNEYIADYDPYAVDV